MKLVNVSATVGQPAAHICTIVYTVTPVYNKAGVQVDTLRMGICQVCRELS